MGPFHCSKQHSILSRRSRLEAMLRRASDIIWTVECEGGYCSQHHPCYVLGAVLYDPSLISYYIPPRQHHLVYATECQNEMITYCSGLNEKSAYITYIGDGKRVLRPLVDFCFVFHSMTSSIVRNLVIISVIQNETLTAYYHWSFEYSDSSAFWKVFHLGVF